MLLYCVQNVSSLPISGNTGYKMLAHCKKYMIQEAMAATLLGAAAVYTDMGRYKDALSRCFFTNCYKKSSKNNLSLRLVSYSAALTILHTTTILHTI